MKYRYNSSCGCARCRAHGFMGPAVLITLGVLFLLDQVVHVYWMEFGRTWPALLIVIGLVMFLQHNAPATGHVPREYMGVPPGQPVAAWQQQQPQQPQWHPPVVTPPQAPEAGPFTGTDKPEVPNG
jgi:hypothetical protein